MFHVYLLNCLYFIKLEGLCTPAAVNDEQLRPFHSSNSMIDINAAIYCNVGKH